MNTQLLEAHPSPDRSTQPRVADDLSSAPVTAPRSTEARIRAVTYGSALQARLDRELAAERLLLVTVPRR